MSIKVTYYLDVVSSWCHWAEPAWAELKRRYADRAEFHWRIALLGPESMPVSRNQEDWFYRRSGVITNSPYRLRSDWMEPGLREYLAPNCVALAARDLGAVDDRVRLAIAHAAMREGRKVGIWEESADAAASASGLNPRELLDKARSPEIERQARETTVEFHGLKINQRPAFVLDNAIEDRVVFSGFWRFEPIDAAMQSLLADAAAYSSWKAHFGAPPAE